MNRTLLILPLLLGCPVLSAAMEPVRMIVVDFAMSAEPSDLKEAGRLVADQMEVTYGYESCFEVLDRKHWLETKIEFEFQSNNNKSLDPETRITLLTKGAQYITLGRIVWNQSGVRLEARVIEISTTRIVAADNVMLSGQCMNMGRALKVAAADLARKLTSAVNADGLGVPCSKGNLGPLYSVLGSSIVSAVCNELDGNVTVGVLPVQTSTALEDLSGRRAATLIELTDYCDDLNDFSELIPTTESLKNLEILGCSVIRERDVYKAMAAVGLKHGDFTVPQNLLRLTDTLALDMVLIPSMNITAVNIQWGCDSVIDQGVFEVDMALHIMDVHLQTKVALFDTTVTYTYEPSDLKLEIEEITIDRVDEDFHVAMRVRGKNMYHQIQWISVDAVFSDSSVMTTDALRHDFKCDQKNRISKAMVYEPSMYFPVHEIESFYFPFRIFKEEIQQSSYVSKPDGELGYFVFPDWALERFEFFEQCKRCTTTFWFLVKFGMIDRRSGGRITLATVRSDECYRVCNVKGSEIGAFLDVCW